ncbi:xanthine dehydrogenase molybdopterin binding subunit [Glaciecola sp. 2405UD65-10]|uniref:xanthine dehydrogenase molybdopterin binding subunit n=1 Tax=Glaciecola sp. 2405UD65-10 TaxID=3397244 RepID=UPI003B5C4F99
MRKLVENTTTSKGATSQVGSQYTKACPHESAVRQVSGEARYVDDIPAPANLQYAAVGLSPFTSGTITKIDVDAVWQSPGVLDVITADDVPGHIDIGPVFKGDPVLAHKEIKFHAQPVFAVLAKTQEQAQIAASLGKIEVNEQTAILSVAQAKSADTTVRPPHFMQAGNYSEAIKQAEHTASGSLEIGGQEHLYLEGQVSMALPQEEERMFIYTSSQHPSEVQKLVAEVLDIKLNKVVVDMRRMGGGFGGKETQAAQWACIAALFAARQNCAVKLRLPRQQDMMITGKRHPFENSYEIGFDSTGLIQAANIELNGNCGHSPDLSDAIVDRAMFHADNGYYLPHCNIAGHRLKTHQVSHTAYRGFGGPQGMIMAEAMLDKIARAVKQDPLTVRKRNLYGPSTGMTTPYGMQIEQNLLPEIIESLEASSDYWARREAITAYNKTSPIIKKGLALTPVKFGISFTAKHLNQAGALVHIYTDGSVQANHGGTEMGQGLHTKISQIVANEFALNLDEVEVTSTRTDKVPNTSPTAASSGTDLNGKAVQNACITIKQRLAEFYAQSVNGDVNDVRFENQTVYCNEHSLPWFDLIQQAYFARVSLSSSGFYKTPKLAYDRETGKGRPFFYFAYGASATEVSIDTLTGEYKVERVDILHDVGTSLNKAIDIGQIEGGFIQGMGWLTTEELKWDDGGKLSSNNLATYKIPAIGDTPKIFNVDLFDRPNNEDSIYHSKAVGEPPFMLAISVWCALKDAIASLHDYASDPTLHTPATPERIMQAIASMRDKH